MYGSNILCVGLALGTVAASIAGCGSIPEDSGTQASATACETHEVTDFHTIPVGAGFNGSARCFGRLGPNDGGWRSLAWKRFTGLGLTLPANARVRSFQIAGELETNIPGQLWLLQTGLTANGRYREGEERVSQPRTNGDGQLNFTVGSVDPGATDMWGLSWTPQTVNSRNFGFGVYPHIKVTDTDCPGSGVESVDYRTKWLGIRVAYTVPDSSCSDAGVPESLMVSGPTVTPSPLVRGESGSLSASFQAPTNAFSGHFVFAIFTISGERLGSKVDVLTSTGTRLNEKKFIDQHLNGGEQVAHTWNFTVPADLALRRYRAVVQVFPSDWGHLVVQSVTDVEVADCASCGGRDTGNDNDGGGNDSGGNDSGGNDSGGGGNAPPGCGSPEWYTNCVNGGPEGPYSPGDEEWWGEWATPEQCRQNYCD